MKTDSNAVAEPQARSEVMRSDLPQEAGLSWTPGYLRQLGIYGYEHVESVILASLITGDPLMLIGPSGTGKTYLLNGIAEALGLQHRHYNASLVSFDDLVGFPLPDSNQESVKFLQTPATIWGAESVLVDELNRCKPEHQNRFFSLVHERRLQGIMLDSLQYRWAAMNPVSQDDMDEYSGCDPLDAALADRFSFLIEVNDWNQLTEEDQQRVANPFGDDHIATRQDSLKALLSASKLRFHALSAAPSPYVVTYCIAMANHLAQAGVRISPRRVRQWVRNIIAVFSLCEERQNPDWESLIWNTIKWSIPQRTAAKSPEETVLRSAHRLAWGACGKDVRQLWLNDLMREPLPVKVEIILRAPDPDLGTAAVNLLLRELSPIRKAIFAITLFPALMHMKEPTVGPDGLNDLGAEALPFFHSVGEHRFRDPVDPHGKKAPGADPILIASQKINLNTLKRRKRLENLLQCLLLKRIPIPEAQLLGLEDELQRTWIACRNFLTQKEYIK